MDLPFETMVILLAFLGLAMSIVLIIFFTQQGGLFRILELILGSFR